MAGPTPSVSLSSMRVLQAYIPARIGDVCAAMRDCRMSIVVDVCDAAARTGTAELERALADVCFEDDGLEDDDVDDDDVDDDDVDDELEGRG